MVLRDMSLNHVMHAFQSERGLSSALDQVVEAIAILGTKDGAIIYSNAAFSRTFGSPSQWVPEQKLVELFQMDEECRTLAAALEQARSGKAWMGHFFLKTTAGKGTEFEGALSPVYDDEGVVESLVVRLRDVTLEAERDQQLRLTQKMSALGALAGGVAHDFNNLIGAILATAEQIEMQMNPDNPVQRKLEIIQQVGERAKGLTAQILNFSRRADGNGTLIDLSNLVAEVTDLLRTTSPGNVKVRSDLTKGICIFGDPSQLHQVIMNLGINASQAMQPQGGTLSIQLRQVAASPEVAVPSFSEPCVQLTVEDTGCGMDPHTMERIFEPFFTTKAAGRGTGLGLSLVHNIIRGHGGNLQVSSRPGRGSSFQIFLPVNHDRHSGPRENLVSPHLSAHDRSPIQHPVESPGSPWQRVALPERTG